MYRNFYVSLGSNETGAPSILSRALSSIALIKGITLISASSIYQTEPQDYKNQPWFHNQAAKFNCAVDYSPAELLNQLLALEKALGRTRARRFGPRKIDIDLLLYDNFESMEPYCLLPHPRMRKRAFVLVPLLEIEKDITINNVNVSEYLNKLDWRLEGVKIYQK